MKATKDLTTGNIWRNFILYNLPLLGSALLSSAYNTVDAMIAGKFISEHALGAINATSSFDMIFHALFIGFAAGFSVYVALLFGQKNYTRMKNDIVQVLMLVAAVTVVISVCSILLRDPIMDYLKVDPVLRADAERYFVIYTSGYIITYINFVLVQTLHALGVTSFSFYVSLISAVLNIGGNLLTVLVFDMGVAGLAVSTLFSAAAATAVYVILLRRAFCELPSEKISYRFRLADVRRSLRYTVPAALQQLSYHGVGFLIAPSINGLGADATTGYTVANRVNSICSNSFWSGAGALGCHTSQCVGAGKHEKIRKGLWVNLWICIGILTPMMLAIIVLARPLTSVFFPAGYTGTAFQYAVRFLTFYLPFLFVNMLGHLLHAYMRGLGAMNVVMVVSLIGSAARFVLTLLLTPSMGMDGIYTAWVIGWFADTVVSLAIFLLRYRTRKHILRAIGSKGNAKEQAGRKGD